jgi:hypothetical protein
VLFYVVIFSRHISNLNFRKDTFLNSNSYSTLTSLNYPHSLQNGLTSKAVKELLSPPKPNTVTQKLKLKPKPNEMLSKPNMMPPRHKELVAAANKKHYATKARHKELPDR